MSGESPLKIWWITDGKPGHRNQLLGLAERLKVHATVQERWFDLNEESPSWFFRRGNSEASHWFPDMVIGAGHRTHRHLLMAKWIYRKFSVVLMSPSISSRWFDAAIIPAHDHPEDRENVLITQGVLNTIAPSHETRDPNAGLVLIGGDSKHFEWDNESVLKQVREIAGSQPNVRWTLTNSRRTPEGFSKGLLNAPPANLDFVPHEKTQPGWVAEKLATARQVWVSPDSVSMVYESLTAGAPTGLLALEASGNTRVVNGLKELENRKWVAPISQMEKGKPIANPPETLWESERAARWLLDIYARVRQ